MDFYFLGPLMVKNGNIDVGVPATRDRKILGALLLNSNQPVHLELLIDAVWDDDPPATARQQVQNRLGSLRARLGAESHQRIVRSGNNYTMRIADEQVDGLKFRNLQAEAMVAAQNRDPERAVELLRSGLELWRGAPMEDINSIKLQAGSAHWKEYHLKAIEMLVDLEFSLHRHRMLTPDLHRWTSFYPYHEGLHCRLAEAMQASSRTAEALVVIHGLRTRLAHDLGISTGPAVEDLYHRLLHGTYRTPVMLG
ncbi:AfsR/SARP family transcriptional regulator [Micromonospora gifhornensis]|uniref:AfsR/SARP family transcriptional regulator n=1 Tax=Micromonospora gifhornensis TaxID=84594 RepID=UPI00365E0B95